LKTGNNYFLQLTRHLVNDEKYIKLSINAKWLFVVLNELEQRYTGKNKNFFFRSNEDLAVDMGVSVRTLIRAKNELIKTDLIHSWQAHFITNEGTPYEKRSEERITCYRILK